MAVQPSLASARPRPRPSAVAIEPQIGVVPTLGRPPLAVRPAVWPVRHVLPEAFQAGATAGVDELIAVHGRIITETVARRPSYRIRDETCRGDTEKETASCVDPSSRA